MQNMRRILRIIVGCFCLCLIASVCPTLCFADENAQARPLEERFAEASELSEAFSLSLEGLSTNQLSISEESDRVSSEGVAFGFTDFSRYNKGTNKEFEGLYYGYRFPAGSREAFSVVVCEGYTIVYVPQSATTELSLDIADRQFQQDFISLLQGIDKAASLGGTLQSSLGQPYYFTQEKNFKVGDYLYSFGLELGEDRFYTAISLMGSTDGSGGVIYSESGKLTDEQDISIAAPATGWESVEKFFTNLDYRPLWVSIKTSGTALLFIFFLGLLAAWATIKASDRFKAIFDTVFTIPMVLPPVVCGFLLLMLFGTSTSAGQWLIDHGINIVFTWPAAVIACVVVGFPLMYRTARGAFENLDVSMLDAARTLGWSERRIFIRLMVPLAWPSIAAGTILAFARAMGEFGATLFFAGNYAGITQTIPLAIYFQWMGGNTDAAIFWVIVVIVISFLIIMLINIYSARTQKYRKGERRELES